MSESCPHCGCEKLKANLDDPDWQNIVHWFNYNIRNQKTNNPFLREMINNWCNYADAKSLELVEMHEGFRLMKQIQDSLKAESACRVF